MSALTPVNLTLAGPPQRIDSPSKFSVYCNATEILASGWDVRINLMENIPPQDGKPVMLVHGSVVMSPVHAKAVLMALTKSIGQYEEKFGEIDAQKIIDFQSLSAQTSIPPSD